MQIDLLMDEVNEYAEDKILHFDEWLEFGTFTFAKKLLKKQVLEKFIALDKAVDEGCQSYDSGSCYGVKSLFF